MTTGFSVELRLAKGSGVFFFFHEQSKKIGKVACFLLKKNCFLFPYIFFCGPWYVISM